MFTVHTLFTKCAPLLEWHVEAFFVVKFTGSPVGAKAIQRVGRKGLIV